MLSTDTDRPAAALHGRESLQYTPATRYLVTDTRLYLAARLSTPWYDPLVRGGIYRLVVQVQDLLE